MAQLSFVIFSEREDFAGEVGDQLGATGHADVAAIVCEPEDLVETVRVQRPDVLFADLGVDAEGVLGVLETLPAPRPAFLLAGPQDDSQLILRAMRLGAKEFFSHEPSAEALRSAVERLVLEVRPAPLTAQRIAPVIAVMGAKGGVGATVVACQLAASLQRLGGRTVVVDLNLPLGDVALHFDIEPTYTMVHLVQETERLDATYLRTLLQGHRSGVQILAAPRRVEEAEQIRGHHVERVLGLLRNEFDWVILDVSRSWDEASLKALDLADQILLVTLLDVPTLSHAKQHLDLLKRLGNVPSKIRVIANRYSTSDAVTDRDVAQFLGETPHARIPNDYPTTVSSVNQGRPIAELAPRSPIHRSYAQLAATLYEWCEVERPTEQPEAKLGARVRRLFRKRDHGTH